MLSIGIFSHFSLDGYLNFFVNESHHGDGRYFHLFLTSNIFLLENNFSKTISETRHSHCASKSLRGPHLARGPPV